MFELLVLCSSEDLYNLQSLRAPSITPSRIKPIADTLLEIVVHYMLGDRPWFHSNGGLKAHGAPHLRCLYLRITGPATPVFTALKGDHKPIIY